MRPIFGESGPVEQNQIRVHVKNLFHASCLQDIFKLMATETGRHVSAQWVVLTTYAGTVHWETNEWNHLSRFLLQPISFLQYHDFCKVFASFPIQLASQVSSGIGLRLGILVPFCFLSEKKKSLCGYYSDFYQFLWNNQLWMCRWRLLMFHSGGDPPTHPPIILRHQRNFASA